MTRNRMAVAACLVLAFGSQIVFGQAKPPASSGAASDFYLDGGVILSTHVRAGGVDAGFVAATSITATGTVRGGRFDNGATSAGVRFSGSDTYVAATSNTGSVLMSNDTNEHATFDGVGAFVFTQNPGAKPTCNSANRGKLWRTTAASLSADTLEWCCKNTSDAYAWTALSNATCP